MSQIIPTAEPFFFPGKPGKPGCLLTHGFTGAPKEMRWMGEYLNREHGFTCLGIRLTGHATQPEAMIRSRYTDWMASMEDGYHLLRGAVDKIFLAGLSMGGILSLLMSTRLDVAGVVAMSTPHRLPDDPRLKLAKVLSKIQPFLPKNKEGPGAGWFGDAWKQHVAYPQNPVRCIAELNELLGCMRLALPEIRVPVLLISSRDDHYIVENSLDSIYSALQTTIKEKLWIEGSGHVITEEPQREFVFQAAAEFINRIATG